MESIKHICSLANMPDYMMRGGWETVNKKMMGEAAHLKEHIDRLGVFTLNMGGPESDHVAGSPPCALCPVRPTDHRFLFRGSRTSCRWRYPVRPTTARHLGCPPVTSAVRPSPRLSAAPPPVP